jgi:lysyl-tRNA synthetase class II
VDRELVELIDYGMPASSGMWVWLNRLYLALRPEWIDNDIKSTIPFP